MPSRLTRQSFACRYHIQLELLRRSSGNLFSFLHFFEETFAVELLQPAVIDVRFDVAALQRKTITQTCSLRRGQLRITRSARNKNSPRPASGHQVSWPRAPLPGVGV